MLNIGTVMVTINTKVDKIYFSKKRGIGCWRIISSISGHGILGWIVFHAYGETHIFKHDKENCPQGAKP